MNIKWILALIPIFLFSVLFISCQPQTSGDVLKNDYFRGKISVYGEPALNNIVGLTFDINPVMESPNTRVYLDLPREIQLLSGDTVEQIGNVQANQKTRISYSLKTTALGEWQIEILAISSSDNSDDFNIYQSKLVGENSYYTYFETAENSGTISNVQLTRPSLVQPALPRNQ